MEAKRKIILVTMSAFIATLFAVFDFYAAIHVRDLAVIDADVIDVVDAITVAQQ